MFLENVLDLSWKMTIEMNLESIMSNVDEKTLCFDGKSMEKLQNGNSLILNTVKTG